MTVPVGPVPGSDRRVGPGAAALEAARAADEKLGEATVVLAMGELLGVTDAFVITHGRNARQVRTLVDEIERRVKEVSGRSPGGGGTARPPLGPHGLRRLSGPCVS